jgi:carbonic anhydrase
MLTSEFERNGMGWLRAIALGLILALGSGAAVSCKSKAEAETSEHDEGEDEKASVKKKSKKSKAKKDEESESEEAGSEHAENPKGKAKGSEAEEKAESKKDAHASGGHSAPKAAIPASEALTLLKEGNAAFLKGGINISHLTAERRASLAGGQQPFAIILSCSDSRVPPEDVFAQGLGDLFVVRVAGNVADPATVASIEYAAAHLGSSLLVVMGHTECGAVKAAMAGANDTPSIAELVKTIQPALAGVSKKDTETAVQANVSHARAEVLRQSKLLGGLVQEKKLKVVEAVYDLKTGKVKFM